MKDHLRELVRGLDPHAGRNVMREYLQARILEGLQRVGAMSPLAFQGGTALRFLYRLPRYSEDLDFALEGPRESYDPRRWLTSIAAQFRREGYDARASLRDAEAVHAGWFRFRGLPHEFGLSSHRDETLRIKLEVDTRPPAGAVTETRLVRRHVSLRIHHHDRASLLAGKLHAVLHRPWLKGRDIYDLVWYLSDPAWPVPNLDLLNAARRQTEPAAAALTEDTWRETVAARVAGVEWTAVEADVRPFLESAKDVPARNDVLNLLGPDR
ncbi:nucleotidyl transferase AbiEii/AbiGii toxin family protein [Candidatus Palauibacter sp.]|uniref:nucleotidyl transferase AbiEii/AbiGii toxin family protein n=1 Tax=Candidatus Palauibacter sp. TaxID=3101350 RepID=UPI003D097DAB